MDLYLSYAISFRLDDEAHWSCGFQLFQQNYYSVDNDSLKKREKEKKGGNEINN